MKMDPVTTFLLVLLTLCVAATAGVSYAFVRGMRTLQTLQYQSVLVSRNRAVAQALANETLEYSKRNPAILPILQSIRIAETNKSQPR